MMEPYLEAAALSVLEFLRVIMTIGWVTIVGIFALGLVRCIRGKR